MAMKRKEEYLGARVPKELKERVILRAVELGIPVSILIRNILEAAFSDTAFKQDIHKTRIGTDVYRNGSDKVASNQFPSVLGWEDIRLNRSASCAGCGKNLQPGSHVTLGISSPGEERIILCDICKESL